MSLAEVAALIAAIAFLLVCAAVAVPLLRLRHTVDAATETLNDLNDRLGPVLNNVNTTIESVNTALGQTKVTLDGVNLQLARLDAITAHVSQVTANVANLTTVLSSAAASPLTHAAGHPVRRSAQVHHALWHPDHGDAPRYGTARCAAEPAQLRADPAWADHVAQALPPEFADEPLLDGFSLVPGLDGDAVPWDGPTVRVVEHPRTPPATLRCSSRTAAC